MSEKQISEQEIKLRCIGIAMGIENSQHQYELQTWAKSGQEGTPPPPPTTVDIFDAANEIFEYVSTSSNVVEENTSVLQT